MIRVLGKHNYSNQSCNIGTADAHHSPCEFLLAQKERVPIATWGQVPIILDILDNVPIARARNYADLNYTAKDVGLPGNTKVVLHLQRCAARRIAGAGE